MDYDHDFLRRQAKTEMHIEKLVNGGWLVSVHPLNGDAYTPFMAFSSAAELMSELTLLTGAGFTPNELAKMSSDEYRELFCTQRQNDVTDFGNGQSGMQNDKQIAALEAIVGKTPGGGVR